MEIADQDNQAIQQFVWGSQYIDEAICMDVDTDSDGDCTDLADTGTNPAGGARRFFYMQDANWNVVTLTETTSAGPVVRERYEYDPYGTVRIYKGVPETGGAELRQVTGQSLSWLNASVPGNPHMYCGYFQDSETDKYHVRHRMLGADRWMQRDMIGLPGYRSLRLLAQPNIDAAQEPTGDRETLVLLSHLAEPFAQAEATARITAVLRLGSIGESPILWQYINGLNLYDYVQSSPLIHTDPSGTTPPVVVVGGAAVAAAAACIVPYLVTMHMRSDWTNDKYAHCVVSCQITKTCGDLVANAAGYAKELRDEIQKRLRDRGVGWDPKDILANKDGISCAPSGWWWLLPPVRWGIGIFGESCDCCCKKAGHKP